MKTLASDVRSILLSAPEVGQLQKLRRSSVLFTQEQRGAGMFLLESGLVKLIRTSRNGAKLILSVVGSNQLVGDESLASTAGAYFADVVCLTDVTGYYIPTETVNRLISKPDFASTILDYAVLRDQERVEKIELLTSYDVEQRILYGLATLAELVKPNGDGMTYSIPVTQLELASFVGATRETTSTTLSNLQNRQLVTLRRRLVTTVDPEQLIAAASGKFVRTRANATAAGHHSASQY